MFFLTTLEALWYGHFVLTQIALGQSHRTFQAYWWWYVCAEEAVC
jgi:hypothetical protein